MRRRKKAAQIQKSLEWRPLSLPHLSPPLEFIPSASASFLASLPFYTFPPRPHSQEGKYPTSPVASADYVHEEEGEEEEQAR